MNILALEPYYGGSHRAFLDGWATRSRYHFAILDLPPRKWKWRMRHAAITFADAVRSRLEAGEKWDLLLCSDMLNLAEFVGLAPPAVQCLPRVVYFHENQLTYPFRVIGERDLHFGFTNMTTALAADAVWFNTAFHRDDFLAALQHGLKRMPDHRPMDAVDRIRAKSCVQPPGVEICPREGHRHDGPLRIAWAARWEHDKNPELFFAAMRLLRQRGVAFRMTVLGEQFADSPPVFDAAREEFREQIDRWGYQPTRDDYAAALHDADVLVSTADHEFFGISVVEGLLAGCLPVLPRRLAYPELLELDRRPEAAAFFYDGDAASLAGRLAELAGRLETDNLWPTDSDWGRQVAERFRWPQRAAEMDDALQGMCG